MLLMPQKGENETPVETMPVGTSNDKTDLLANKIRIHADIAARYLAMNPDGKVAFVWAC